MVSATPPDFHIHLKQLLYANCINVVGYSYKEIHVVLKMYPELLHIQNTSRVCVLGISVAYF